MEQNIKTKAVLSDADLHNGLQTTAYTEVPTTNNWFAVISKYRLGDESSIVGLVVSVVGLVLTYREARKARTAAEAAKVAAEDARRGRQLVDVSMDLATISDRLQELKYLIKGDDWSTIASRIDSLCKSLAATKVEMLDGEHRDFSPDDIRLLDAAKTKLREFETKLMTKGAKPPSTPKAVTAVDTQIIVPLTQMMDEVTGIQHRTKLLSSRR